MYVFMMFAPSPSKTLPSGSPLCNSTSGALAPGSSQDPVSLRSRSRNDSNTVPVSVSIIHLFKSTLQVLYIYIRRMSSKYLRALQTSWRGWAVSKAVHSMECRGGAHALLGGYLSVGAAACDALHCQHWEVNYLKLVLTLKEPNNRLTDPGSYAWVVFIVGDTLRHQPMVVSHMSVLQFRGPITYCVLQWCHPMLTGTQRRTSCSTRMITLYGDHVIKLDSGPRISLPFLVDLPL